MRPAPGVLTTGTGCTAASNVGTVGTVEVGSLTAEVHVGAIVSADTLPGACTRR